MLLICVKAIKEPDWVYVNVYVIGYRKRQIFNRTRETAFLEAAQFFLQLLSKRLHEILAFVKLFLGCAHPQCDKNREDCWQHAKRAVRASTSCSGSRLRAAFRVRQRQLEFGNVALSGLVNRVFMLLVLHAGFLLTFARDISRLKKILHCRTRVKDQDTHWQ